MKGYRKERASSFQAKYYYNKNVEPANCMCVDVCVEVSATFAYWTCAGS